MCPIKANKILFGVPIRSTTPCIQGVPNHTWPASVALKLTDVDILLQLKPHILTPNISDKLFSTLKTYHNGGFRGLGCFLGTLKLEGSRM